MKKIEIKLYGYGGELTAGTLSDEQYEEFVDNEDIQSLDWYEIDDLFHAHGCSPSGSKIQVIDSDGKVIYDDDIYELNMTYMIIKSVTLHLKTLILCCVITAKRVCFLMVS